MRVRFLLWLCAAAVFVGFCESASGETGYFALFMDGKKVGHAMQIREVADGNVRTTENSSITLTRANMPISVKMSETSIETVDGKPLGFESIQDMGLFAMKVSGKIDAQGSVVVTVESMGNKQEQIIQWPAGAVMSEGLRLLTLKKGLKEGMQYTAKLFSPALMQALDINVVVGAKEQVDLLGRVVTLTKTTTTFEMPGSGPITSTSYVTDELEVQKNIMPLMGMTVEMIACEKEFALSENDILDVVDKMFLVSPQVIKKINGVKSITYSLKSADEAEKLQIPSTDNQQVSVKGNVATVTVERSVIPKGGKFPYRGKDKRMLKALKPTRFVQSDHEHVIKLAKRAVGRTKNAGEAVKKIETFVANYMENKNLSVGYASAAEVAVSKQGDCSEFSVLTAAMCRAVGIPAEVVMGIAYVDEFGNIKNRFGGHAWVQVYVGQRWYGIDSTFKSSGRGGYDAGHIALAVGHGDPEDFFGLVSSLGKFEIEKLVVSR